MRKSRLFTYLLVLLMALAANSCNSGLNLFTVQQDIELGLQVAQEIENDPQQFPILPENGNRELYKYVRGLTNRLLNTGKVDHRNDFAWQVKIIDDPETLNAFCTPGGHIYVYTGLIKFLDSEDQLAGVMGHEIAHAARRHSTQQLTRAYGVAFLADALLGNRDALKQIIGGLVSLRFSRDHERDADAHSVIYLCATEYNAAGAAGFFKKMEGQPTPPEFISTHPNPDNRVADIEQQAKSLGCTGSSTNSSEYARIKALIK